MASVSRSRRAAAHFWMLSNYLRFSFDFWFCGLRGMGGFKVFQNAKIILLFVGYGLFVVCGVWADWFVVVWLGLPGLHLSSNGFRIIP